MFQELKNGLIDLFHSLTYKKENEILREQIKKQEIALTQAKKKLEEVEHDLLISDGYENIEIISRHLTYSLEKIKEKDKIVFCSNEDELENSIFAISNSLENLIERRNNRKIIKINYEAYYANNFLKNYEYFKSFEWRKERCLRYHRGKSRK